MLNKILKITAAAAFMVALAVNIDMMINDPFVGMSTDAIATDTDSGTTSGYNSMSKKYGKITETANTGNNTFTRTCKYVETICEGTGTIKCTPSLLTYDCTVWTLKVE